MPRIARRRSTSGIYHVMLRGSNKQAIYHDDEDCGRFLEILGRYKAESGIEVYGWCLMINHVHLLLREGRESLSSTMKRIGVSYVGYYNRKYRNIGHLFQDRYRSEAVENDQYLLAAARYIHQNPVKAGMVKKPDEWLWSSSAEYSGQSDNWPMLLDGHLILGMFSDNLEMGRAKFREYNNKESQDSFIDNTQSVSLSDEEAKIEINRLIGTHDSIEIRSMAKKQRDELLAKIKRIDGLSQRQAARILNVSPNLFFKL